MTLHIAFQMDPIEAVDIDADSSFYLALEAQNRGYRVSTYHPDQLAYEQGRITARARSVRLRREQGNHAEFGAEVSLNLAKDVDVVWLRQDPPFDMGYITSTHLLDRLDSHTLVVNNPFWVRNAPEKLLVLDYPDLTPPTTVTRDLETLKAFKAQHGDVILKPLYGNGGAGVFKLTAEDRNLNSLHELFASINCEPLIVQKFLPDVAQGDKRIILVEGEPIGAINRVPAAGETRSNMHVGGRPEKTGLSDRDREICAAIGPMLKQRGQVFVGIDVIGPYLTEINLTSPTGLQELERFDGTNSASLIWDAIEARLAG